MKLANKMLSAFCTAAMMMLITAQAYAQSVRVNPLTGYDAVDIRLDWPAGKTYDVVYAELATPYISGVTNDTRAFLHADMMDPDGIGYNGDESLDIKLYDYIGGDQALLTTVPQPVWAQCVKQIGSKVWYSFTGSANDGFYSIPWSKDLAAPPYPVTHPNSPDIPLANNWEIEERPGSHPPLPGGGDGGALFVCGAPPPSAHSIYYYDALNLTLVKVVDVGGYSSGFAFDSAGNLWSGEYLLDNNWNIKACNVYMWTKAAIDLVIKNNASALTTINDPLVTIALGHNNGDNWGPNDIEADSVGNIYISLNAFPPNQFNANNEDGKVIKITSTLVVTDLVTLNPTPEFWDWSRTLAYDGDADIDTCGYTDPTVAMPTGNRLYLDMDMDQPWSLPPPAASYDDIVGIARNCDFDGDGVPDSLDNAPETAPGTGNPNQIDADFDMYGNLCDGDFNNDNVVGLSDFNYFKSKWLLADPVADMDSNGTVGLSNFNLFKGRWLGSAPYF